MKHGLHERYEAYSRRLRESGQSHLLAFWDQLDDAQRLQLLEDLDRVDFERCAGLIESYVRNKPVFAPPREIEPPNALPAEPVPQGAARYREARERGVEAIRGGRVAAFTV